MAQGIGGGDQRSAIDEKGVKAHGLGHKLHMLRSILATLHPNNQKRNKAESARRLDLASWAQTATIFSHAPIYPVDKAFRLSTGYPQPDPAKPSFAPAPARIFLGRRGASSGKTGPPSGSFDKPVGPAFPD